jgi:outer membrane protein insertion porin family
LKERGYYFFNSDNIIIQADSAAYKVRIRLKLKENTPNLATERYFIDKIIVIPNFNIQDQKNGKYQIPMKPDSLNKYSYGDIFIIDSGKKFRRKTFENSFSFGKENLYNRTDHNLSLSRLSNLGVFKFVKNEFLISDTLNHKFDVYYLLTPRQFQSLRLEALGRTNSANYSGGEINLNWTHRNIFKGAEHLRIALYGEFDIQLGGPKDANNIIRTGTELLLSVPRLWAPFRLKHRTSFIPRTNIALGYELQSRTQLYSMNNFKASFGYHWKENIRIEHDLKIFDLTFVSPAYITDKYESMMDSNEYLQRVVEQQLIFGPVYSYTFTNTMLPLKNTVYYKGTLDLAGTLFGLLSGANLNSGIQKKILGIPFSQYAKIENDFRFYHKMGKSFTAAGRIFAGLAYPYGNSDNIPFTKQFFSGGSNSVRAFRARTLGPGSFDPTNTGSSFFFDQSGDIRLELNAEIRAKLYQFIHLAVFADAGNIWLVNEDIERPGAAFSKNFIHEIAIGGGIGLRLDFSILVLRLDLSMPFRIPYFAPDERWAFDKINFNDPVWRKNNLILNIAIGYPF